MYATYNSFRDKTSPSPQLWAGEPPQTPGNWPAGGNLTPILLPRSDVKNVSVMTCTDTLVLGEKLRFEGNFYDRVLPKNLSFPCSVANMPTLFPGYIVHTLHALLSTLRKSLPFWQGPGNPIQGWLLDAKKICQGLACFTCF